MLGNGISANGRGAISSVLILNDCDVKMDKNLDLLQILSKEKSVTVTHDIENSVFFQGQARTFFEPRLPVAPIAFSFSCQAKRRPPRSCGCFSSLE